MEIYSTKPVKEVSKEEFQYLIKGKEVMISPHAIWHLSNHQRKVFNVNELILEVLNSRTFNTSPNSKSAK